MTPTAWWQQCAHPAPQAGGRSGDWASALATNVDVPAIALRPSAAACSSVWPGAEHRVGRGGGGDGDVVLPPVLEHRLRQRQPDLPPVAVALDDQVRPALRVAANG